MSTTQISRARQSQLAAAFRAGRTAASAKIAGLCEFDAFCASLKIENPYADRDGMMPAQMASVRAAQWHAFVAGIDRALGKINDAGTMLRNARFCLRRATELGRA